MNAPARGPLRGTGIVITRPAKQAAALAQQVAALGATPLVFPAIVILPPADHEPLERARRELGRYDHAIFVSVNAVEHAFAHPLAWPERVHAFAPGPGTAAALDNAGVLGVHLPATTMDSEGLLALPELADVAGKRIAIFRGSGGRELLGETLTARGAQVDRIECYRRAKPASGAAGLIEAWRETRVDAVSITSSEGLDNLWDMLDDPTRARFRHTATFVPHVRIAKRARALALKHVVVTAPTDAGLLASLLEYFADPGH